MSMTAMKQPMLSQTSLHRMGSCYMMQQAESSMGTTSQLTHLSGIGFDGRPMLVRHDAPCAAAVALHPLIRQIGRRLGRGRNARRGCIPFRHIHQVLPGAHARLKMHLILESIREK